MSMSQEIADDLKARLALCQELMTGLEGEARALRQPDNPSLQEFHQLRKKLLPALTRSLEDLREHRAHWQKLSREERDRHPEIGALLRENQDMTMKLILLDRENEQGLLRRGLLPANELPAADRQRPHFVADLYRRQSNNPGSTPE
jgi:hypothetical protein